MKQRQGYQLSFKPATPRKSPPRWRYLCRHWFGIEAAHVERFWSNLPPSIDLAPLTPQRIERLHDHLTKSDIVFEGMPRPPWGTACRHHRPLIADINCPVCNQPRACVACLRAEPLARCPNCASFSRLRLWFRRFRIAGLSAILLAVVATTASQRRRLASWNLPVTVAIIPVKGELGDTVRQTVESLRIEQFEDFRRFAAQEAKRYQIDTDPLLDLYLTPAIDRLPPDSPQTTNPLVIAWWSLKLRYWSWRVSRTQKFPQTDIRLFVIYHEPKPGRLLPHSLGLEEGHIGIVYTFGGYAYARATNVAVAHEFFHTVGATDKYDENGHPLYPVGFAEPDRKPLYPQAKAEIMAGVIPRAEEQAELADTLTECVVGDTTAQEIRWVKAP